MSMDLFMVLLATFECFLFSQLALTSCFHIVYCDVCIIQVFQFSYSHYVCMIMWAVFVGAMRVPNKDIMLACIICISMPSLSCSSVDTRGATLMDREKRPRCSQVWAHVSHTPVPSRSHQQ